MTWVSEAIYAAGGEHIPQTWGSFSQQTGIRAVLHLAPGRPMQFAGQPPENFLWMDIEDEEQADLATRQLAASYLIDCQTSGRSILLHSSLGRHRVRWAFVAHQLGTGRRLKTVLRAAAEKPWMGPYHTDQALWQAFCDQFAGSASR